jgi:hypothetical protein
MRPAGSDDDLEQVTLCLNRLTEPPANFRSGPTRMSWVFRLLGSLPLKSGHRSWRLTFRVSANSGHGCYGSDLIILAALPFDNP